MIETYTYSEIEAVEILYGRYHTGNIHKAADEIILLAEKIKAERATVAMQSDAQKQPMLLGVE